MSYHQSQLPGDISSTKNSDNTTPSRNKIFYALCVAFVLTVAGLVVMVFNHRHTLAELTSVTSAKDSLEIELNRASIKIDSITTANVQLNDNLILRTKEVEILKEKIKRLLAGGSNSELDEAKGMIVQLNGKIRSLLDEIERLKKENQELTGQVTQLTTDNEQLTNDKAVIQQSLDETNQKLQSLQDIASTLHASNITISGVRMPGGSETKKAKKANGLKLTFRLDVNRAAPSGSKDLYIIVTNPKGDLVVDTTTTFNARSEGAKSYSVTKTVSYDAENGNAVEVIWETQGKAKLIQGNYKVSIYQNGFKIGEQTVTMKKMFLGIF